METRKRVLGEEHPHTLASMANLAYTWKHQSRNKEASDGNNYRIIISHTIPIII